MTDGGNERDGAIVYVTFYDVSVRKFFISREREREMTLPLMQFGGAKKQMHDDIVHNRSQRKRIMSRRREGAIVSQTLARLKNAATGGEGRAHAGVWVSEGRSQSSER